jgi:arsenical pump membrane protein
MLIGVDALLAGIILVATLALVLVRPGNLSEAWWATLGAALVLILGLVSLQQASEIVLETLDILILLVALMALSAVAEKAEVFDWAASLAARAGDGSVFRLYGFFFVVGTLVTATLSLDATAIVLTPIVYGMVVRLRLSPLPFMFACAYTANTASLFLPTSNLTNLLAYNAFDLGFFRFGLIMFIPATLATLTNALIFTTVFRRDLRGCYDNKLPSFVPENLGFFRLAAVTIVAVLVAFFLAPSFGLPLGLVALAGATLLVLTARVRDWVKLREVAGSVSWGLIPLVVGLFLVVEAVENVGLTSLLGTAFAAAAPGEGFFQIVGVAIGSALGSNLVNNVPMTMATLKALGPLLSDGTFGPAAVYAALLGTNIGPNLTVVGSLATLIWLSIVRGRGMEITAKDYLRIGVVSVPGILLAASLGLWISLRLFGA